MPDAARTYLAIGEQLRLADLAAKAAAIATPDYYDRLAVAQALSQLDAAQAAFTRDAIRAGGGRRSRLARQARRQARTGQEHARGDRRRYHAHGLAAAGGGGPAQRPCGGRVGRSFSISQDGPNSGSFQIRSQRKPARS